MGSWQFISTFTLVIIIIGAVIALLLFFRCKRRRAHYLLSARGTVDEEAPSPPPRRHRKSKEPTADPAPDTPTREDPALAQLLPEGTGSVEIKPGQTAKFTKTSTTKPTSHGFIPAPISPDM